MFALSSPCILIVRHRMQMIITASYRLPELLCRLRRAFHLQKGPLKLQLWREAAVHFDFRVGSHSVQLCPSASVRARDVSQPHTITRLAGVTRHPTEPQSCQPASQDMPWSRQLDIPRPAGCRNRIRLACVSDTSGSPQSRPEHLTAAPAGCEELHYSKPE